MDECVDGWEVPWKQLQGSDGELFTLASATPPFKIPPFGFQISAVILTAS